MSSASADTLTTTVLFTLADVSVASAADVLLSGTAESVALAGASSATDVGSVSLATAETITLSGSPVSTAAGDLVIGGSGTAPLSGASVTAGIGALSAGVFPSLDGSSTATDAGVFTLVEIFPPIDGAAAAMTPGGLAITVAYDISGVLLSADGGVLAFSAKDIPLFGDEVLTSAGTITVASMSGAVSPIIATDFLSNVGRFMNRRG
jgi:hypothetical protein